ncbi:MAG: [FeFe] hydrogenase H-cluster maturation GTPase HydF [Limnochordia bacterium]|nr:[FeFe] hydrogenase H-cluster maturation GTPase HydF [Limnochordia bacterium]MDD2628582.1 [FeFe] hydrogenase H-cluster maturation GTPase HydF [Limnochordia bacterium]
MQDTPRGNRPHIVFVGPGNVGKSSLINAIADQEVSLVSEILGTTTDPVSKAMELPPLGPVLLVDTAGLDDEGALGEKRIKRTKEVLEKADLAVVITDNPKSRNQGLIKLLEEQNTPYIEVLNKGDLFVKKPLPEDLIVVSAKTKAGIETLKDAIVHKVPKEPRTTTIVGDLLNAGDLVLLVVPLDQQAPKGRLILPQVQTIRDLLDHNCQALIVKDSELAPTLNKLKEAPQLVITDSQIFREVAKDLSPNTPLTSFSILFARYKGDLQLLAKGASVIDELAPGDRVLICEACTHRPLEEDIGRVKIPALLQERAGGKLELTWSVGEDFPEDLSQFKLAVHCGGCMITRKTMLQRIYRLHNAGVPVVNYGVLLAYFSGIMPRALEPVLKNASHFPS